MDRQQWRLARAAILLLIVVAGVIASQQRHRDAEPPAIDRPAPHAKQPAEDRARPRVVVEDIAVRDERGRQSFTGDVDLTETLARIDRGERLSFRNDGTVFQNRERRLPDKPRGYYREWVHLTPGLSGPGPQRVVTGQQGDAWYTPDHYQSFRRVR